MELDRAALERSDDRPRWGAHILEAERRYAARPPGDLTAEENAAVDRAARVLLGEGNGRSPYEILLDFRDGEGPFDSRHVQLLREAWRRARQGAEVPAR